MCAAQNIEALIQLFEHYSRRLVGVHAPKRRLLRHRPRSYLGCVCTKPRFRIRSNPRLRLIIRTYVAPCWITSLPFSLTLFLSVCISLFVSVCLYVPLYKPIRHAVCADALLGSN